MSILNFILVRCLIFASLRSTPAMPNEEVDLIPCVVQLLFRYRIERVLCELRSGEIIIVFGLRIVDGNLGGSGILKNGALGSVTRLL